MEATEYMYSGLPIGSVGRLSNHPNFGWKSRIPTNQRLGSKNPDVEICSDISK